MSEQKKEHLVIYDPKNTWIGTVLKNASGYFKPDGNEFRNQAENYANWAFNRDGSGIRSLELIGKNKKQKREYLFKSLEEMAAKGVMLDRIAFFMHGHPKALNRGMIKEVHIPEFAGKIRRITHRKSAVIFYSCKTAKIDAVGFAAEVALNTRLTVVGHSTSGHTTKNPYKKMFFRGRIHGIKMWVNNGGIRGLKDRLWANDIAPFRFVEAAIRVSK